MYVTFQGFHSLTFELIIKFRMSALNCAQIYSTSLSRPENQPSEWPFSFTLCHEHIWSGVSRLAILEHIEQEQETLMVPHGSDQRDQLAEYIKVRNRLFAEKGQPECKGVLGLKKKDLGSIFFSLDFGWTN